MNKKYQKHLFIAAVFLLVSYGARVSAAEKQKTFSGTVTKIDGSLVYFFTSSAATYAADVGHAQLVRKYGASMQFDEIKLGDKIETTGVLWSDNSISVSYFRDVSLYVHNGTFVGKVENIDPVTGIFTIQSRQEGLQTIHTNNYSVFKKNGTSAALADLAPGMSVTLKGSWDRTASDILAKEVSATVRLVNIDLSGQLVMKSDSSVTITANYVIYGIDISKAQTQSKNSKPLPISQYNMGDILRVWGKHVSGSVQIFASLVKDTNISK